MKAETDSQVAAASPHKRIFASLCPPVFLGAAAIIFAVVIFAVTQTQLAANLFGSIQNWVIATFGWYYMLVVAVYGLFSIGLAASSFGRIKLGPDDSEPDFSYLAWFAMLFSAGMGIGLMFYGVAEPLDHFANPPTGAGHTIEAARQSLAITFFHWGVSAWGIYAVIGLSLAYFGFRHNLPLTVRSSLYPLIGERIHGPIGHAVDVFAIVGTMFGVATSLGLGALQVNSGLNFLFHVPQAAWVQIILIAVITGMATTSVVLGLETGIKNLSLLNIFLALLIVLFVLFAGKTLFLLNAMVQNIGAYIGVLIPRTFDLYAYEPNKWLGNWTLFYWSWWIAWSPFVGMFIARVSRGRTIREFLVGVLFVPVGFTIIWMTVFGNLAINLDMGIAHGALSKAALGNASTAIFEFFRYLPFTNIISMLATLLVVTFFVTSSDSASLVIDIIASGGQEDPPVWQRIFWAVTEGVVAAILLLAGGLTALQTASLAAALPFSFALLFVCYGIVRGLALEGKRRVSLSIPQIVTVRGAEVPWQQRLKTILRHPRRERALAFIRDVAAPALTDVAGEFKGMGFEVKQETSDTETAITVSHQGEQDFHYAVELKGFAAQSFAFPELPSPKKDTAHEYYRAEVRLLEGGQQYDVMGYTKEQIISDVLAQYEKHVHFLHLARETATAP